MEELEEYCPQCDFGVSECLCEKSQNHSSKQEGEYGYLAGRTRVGGSNPPPANNLPEENLSSKKEFVKTFGKKRRYQYFYPEKNVKDFIRKLKNLVIRFDGENPVDKVIWFEEIDKLTGRDLLK